MHDAAAGFQLYVDSCRRMGREPGDAAAPMAGDVDLLSRGLAAARTDAGPAPADGLTEAVPVPEPSLQLPRPPSPQNRQPLSTTNKSTYKNITEARRRIKCVLSCKTGEDALADI